MSFYRDYLTSEQCKEIEAEIASLRHDSEIALRVAAEETEARLVAEARVKELEEALRPFADNAARIDRMMQVHDLTENASIGYIGTIKFKHFLEARRVLEAMGNKL